MIMQDGKPQEKDKEGRKQRRQEDSGKKEENGRQ